MSTQSKSTDKLLVVNVSSSFSNKNSRKINSEYSSTENELVVCAMENLFYSETKPVCL